MTGGLRGLRTPSAGLVILAANALPFLLAPARAAALDADGRGALAFFQAALLVIINISILGSRATAYKHDLSGSRRFSIPYAGLLLSSLGVALPVGAACVYLGADFPPSVLAAIGICIILSPLYTLLQFEHVDAQLRGRTTRVVVLVAAPSVVDVLLSSTLLLLGHYSLIRALAVCIAVEASRIAIALYYRISDYLREHVAESSAGLLGDSWRLSLTNVAPTVVLNLDVLILGAIAAPEVLGVYAVAKIGFTLTLVATNAAEGAVVRSLLAQQFSALRRPAAELAGLTCAVVAAGVLAILLLFPASFEGAAPALPLLALAGLVYAMNRWVVLAVAAQHGRRATWAALLGAAAAALACGSTAILARDDVVAYALAYLTAQVAALACSTPLLKTLPSMRPGDDREASAA